MFAMSLSLRFISAGDPAPSMNIKSFSSFKMSSDSLMASNAFGRYFVWYSLKSMSPTALPCTITWEVNSPFGFKRIGFMWMLGLTLAAFACNTCAIAISPSSSVVYEFKDMFWDLNGATLYPLFA